MNEEKQIKEMAKVICKIVNKKELKHCEVRCDIDCLGIAKELLKYYQPKPPKDSVVLTKEELNTIQSNFFDSGIKFGIKETAKNNKDTD